jgi:hypothetical protein
MGPSSSSSLLPSVATFPCVSGSTAALVLACAGQVAAATGSSSSSWRRPPDPVCPRRVGAELTWAAVPGWSLPTGGSRDGWGQARQSSGAGSGRSSPVPVVEPALASLSPLSPFSPASRVLVPSGMASVRRKKWDLRVKKSGGNMLSGMSLPLR